MKTTTVRERPILFSGPMVRAILDGRKTQTRRLVHKIDGPCSWNSSDETGWPLHKDGRGRIICPFGEAGTRLWVRESFDIVDDPAAFHPSDPQPGPELGGYKCPVCVRRGPNGERWVVDYAADGGTRVMDRVGQRRWRPSIHMPRWASRITLEVVSVRVERAQDISGKDVLAEGVDCSGFVSPRGADGFHLKAVIKFAALWESINGKGSFGANPWVWVVSFRSLSPDSAGRDLRTA